MRLHKNVKQILDRFFHFSIFDMEIKRVQKFWT